MFTQGDNISFGMRAIVLVARKSAILESVLDSWITMDHQGRVVEFNPAAERVFGYRLDQALG